MKTNLRTNLLAHFLGFAAFTVFLYILFYIAVWPDSKSNSAWTYIPAVVLFYVWGQMGFNVIRNCWNVYSCKYISHAVNRLVLPSKARIPLGAYCGERGQLTIYFQNIGPECVNGVCSIKLLSSDEVLAKIVFREPERLLSGITTRRNGWWNRGVGVSKRPVFIKFKNNNKYEGSLVLEVDLAWGFADTRLESLIPQNNELYVETSLRGSI